MKKIEELNQIILKDYDNTAGIIVMKSDEILYENYFNGSNPNNAVHIFSVTKSIVSILIGIAIDKGYIKSINDRVLDYFPEYKIKRGEKTIQQITIRHLLTMTAPYKYIFAPYTKHFTNPDSVSSSLNYLGGKKLTEKFRYTPIVGPDILTGILTKATGKTVLEFAREVLFSPLGIQVDKLIELKSKEEQMAYYKEKDVRGWVVDGVGVNSAGWGLSLTARDLLKIGQLLMNGGIYNNQQIVSSSWINDCTKEQSKWEERKLSYGYLWWVVKDGFAALGDGGNVIYINVKENMTITITGYFKPRCKDRLDLIEKNILPIFVNE
ncbi:serine hydrolase domain-containing protein [Anaerorhabdus furcosa]|uniref:CubicO group peptidase, beta-lactamase class C family n=1 Tax=Anaerorhabdus furcosa TaxID=118967 RepID=A0A1T4KAH7_9FIRM|nr:serine hydrolase [Anaerorhabdus furcosa]SJZ39386.1 CubicO group peptidase, beta-lactamase class C family [Anaerorhabdus furcosa]